MAVQIEKATAVENIYKNFYDVLTNISSTFSSIVYPDYPQNFTIIDKSDYPIILLGSPDISWDTFTFGKNLVSGTISLDIETISPKTTDQYASDVISGIEEETDTLATYGLHNVRLDSTTKDVLERGEIVVHVKTLNFSFRVYFSKTRSF